MLLEPLPFEDAREFIPGSVERQIEAYAVLGGTPGYLLELSGSIEKTIKEKILQKNTFLGRDPEFVLREELSEPRNYFSIIRAIARGKTKLGEICNECGLDRGTVVKYLSVLSDIQIIERRVPFGEKKTSRKGIYMIRDNYFKFWFRFAFENLEYIEQDLQQKLYSDIISPRLDAFVGLAFEEICLNWARREYDMPFGRFWEGEIEIDGIGRDGKRRVFIEAKWSKLSKKQVRLELDKLRGKAHALGLEGDYVLCAKEVLGKPDLADDERVITVREMFK